MSLFRAAARIRWIPACAGMTVARTGSKHLFPNKSEGSNAIKLFEVFGILGKRFHGRALGVDFGFQGENISQPRAAMFADIAKG